MERLEPIHTKGLRRVFGLLRVAMGWTFLWAFIDKLFGLGFSTGRNVETGAIVFGGPDAWINGGSPTAGVLGFALKGPFKGFYRIDHRIHDDRRGTSGCRMGGLGLRALDARDRARPDPRRRWGGFAAVGGIIWMGIFFTATAIWPEHNPFLDDHVVEAIVLAALFLAQRRGRYYGVRQGLAEPRLGERPGRTSTERIRTTASAGGSRPRPRFHAGRRSGRPASPGPGRHEEAGSPRCRRRLRPAAMPGSAPSISTYSRPLAGLVPPPDRPSKRRRTEASNRSAEGADAAATPDRAHRRPRSRQRGSRHAVGGSRYRKVAPPAGEPGANRPSATTPRSRPSRSWIGADSITYRPSATVTSRAV